MSTDTRNSVINATHAVATARIPAGGRRISYRGYLIHGEVPSICYVIYGRNGFGQLTELGATRSFADAMGWIDKHIANMQGMIPAGIGHTSTPPARDTLGAAA
ncbi:hypothetical protein GBAR_LOCUS11033 [Geodia barretti]|jgi:ankyrin repeat protein|uniref:Uncharacterized protein n=1 Tax=Geodia barretti TaxID=519541 RepID=A0AA35WEA4_GEOBA|nr:hypothetical protein GBAR_LOCUS11033 [Geodia barretti]